MNATRVAMGPPLAVCLALLSTNVPDFCCTVEADLEAKRYGDDVSCWLRWEC